MNTFLNCFEKKQNRFLFILIVFVLLFVVNCLINLSQPYMIPLIFLSFCLLIVLFAFCYYLVKKYCEKEYYRLIIVLWSIVSILGLIIYCIFLFNRSMTYVDDHTVYFNSQDELLNLFKDNPLKGFAGIVFSLWNSDYSYFITVLLAFPFSFTNGSHEAHIICYYLIFVVPFYLSANILTLNIAKKANVKSKTTVVIIVNICMLLFPLLHFASLLGMPDIFGLFFCFSIMLLLINNSFDKFNWKFASIFTLLVISLVVTRRWYIFWLIGFLPSIFIFVLFNGIINKSIKAKIVVLNEIKTFAFLGVGALVFLAPFIYRTLFVRNYSEEYSAWYLGGFPFEIYNQLGYLGIILAVLLIIGLIYGIVEKPLRIITLSCITGFFLTVFSFTLIQNMGKHQSLCLFPYYAVFLISFIIMSNKRNNKYVRILLNTIIIIVFVLNAMSSILIWFDDLDGVFCFTKYAISSRFKWVFGV